MQFGKLEFADVSSKPQLVPAVVLNSVADNKLQGIFVSEIDPNLADTAVFCETYNIGLSVSANCVVVEARRADKTWYAACIILATNRADINGIIRRHLDARKISFAPMDQAVSMTGMEYGGITPIGLPEDWPVIIDQRVHDTDQVIIGSGFRKSKLLTPGDLLASLSNAIILDIVKE